MNIKTPKILFIDIETSPNIVYSWVVGRKINLNYENIIEERKIICVAWKWNTEKQIHSISWDRLTFSNNDKHILQVITPIINEADLIVAHNGDSYDIRFINSRLIFHGMKPIHHGRTEDTLKQIRNTFYFNSNKLDYVGQYLGLGKKVKVDFNLWKNVINGSIPDLYKMIKYCKEDVKLLEKLYNKIAPFVNQRMNKALVMHNIKDGCPSCGSSSQYLKQKGYRYNPRSVKKKYVCSKCGKWSSF